MTDTNIIHEIATLGLGVLATTLAAILTAFAPRIARALETRLRLDIPDPLVARAERLALDAIAYAEERGRAVSKAFGKRVLSSEKLNMAARYFREHAAGPVLELVRGHVTDWIEARLGILRGVPGTSPWGQQFLEPEADIERSFGVTSELEDTTPGAASQHPAPNSPASLRAE